MASFMAGASTSGPRAASTVALTMSSARPSASLAMVLAVAGASSSSCAQSPSWTCGSGSELGAQRSTSTGLPVTPRKVAAPMKRLAAADMATRTAQPAWVMAEARSASL